MSWNFRILREKSGVEDPEYWYSMREVYYGLDGGIIAISSSDFPVGGESTQGIEWILKQFHTAMGKPVLTPEDLPFDLE